MSGRRSRLRRAIAVAPTAALASALALAIGVALAACSGEARPEAGLVVVDDAGDTVRLAGPARRVVSLIPATTELLFAIGAGPTLVGRTRWCDFPAAAAAVPDVGDGMTPNLEAVAATHPDLVVLYNSGQNGGAAERLRALGIPAIRVRSDLLADVPRLARLLGTLTGRARAADSLSAAFDAALAAATVRPTGRRPSVFLLVWDQPPMTVGKGSYLSELLERAGAVNAYADLPTSSGQISIESVADRNPDLVFTMSEGAPAFAGRPEWQGIPAIRDRRFVHAPGSEFSRPSPRAPAAIRTLAARIAEAGSSGPSR